MEVTKFRVILFSWLFVLLMSDAASLPTLSQSSFDNLNLTNVIVLFRHGDRTPVSHYTNDPYKDRKFWPVGPGQLTPRGKVMQYQLGQYLRQRYGNFLSEAYSENDIYVRSTDVDRTLMSALSNLAGLYPPHGDQIWNSNLAWQPIPVHTVRETEDNLLSSHAKCSRQEYLVEHFKELPDVKAINEKYQWLYEYLTKNTGDKISSMVEVDYIYDGLFIETLYNYTLPEWTKSVFPQPMKYLRDMSFKAFTWTEEMKRLGAGPLIQTILDIFQASTNSSFSNKKFVMFSGHDTTISSLLNGLGMFDPPQAPPYASMIIMEKFVDISNNIFVKFSYRNETVREPYVLKVLNTCDELCPLSEFEHLTKPLRPDDWTAECQAGEADEAAKIITEFSIAVTILLFIVLVISVIVSFCLQKNAAANTKKYSPVNSDY